MEKKKKIPTDINQLAASIVNHATSDRSLDEQPAKEKNPAAVALGRLGGLKGGKARAEKLSPKKRSDIAKRAAKARWVKSVD
jgi:IS5 family transposase